MVSGQNKVQCLTMTFPFIRQVSSKATLPAVCWPVSGSESEHSVPRGARPTGQKCCAGNEKATSQNEVLRLDYTKMYVVTQRSQLIPSPRSSFQWGGVAWAHREKMELQRDVSVNPGSASSHAKPLTNGLDGGNRANSTYRWATRGTACSKCKILNVPAKRIFFFLEHVTVKQCPFFVSQQQPNSAEQISSSEDLNTESVCSFNSASSLPLLRRQRCHIYESTLTLQRISSLLNDEENQSRGDEEEDSRTPSPFHALPDCPELMLTLDGATDPIFLSNLDKDALVGLVLSAEGKLCAGYKICIIHIKMRSKD